jgi:hypothetical protein
MRLKEDIYLQPPNRNSFSLEYAAMKSSQTLLYETYLSRINELTDVQHHCALREHPVLLCRTDKRPLDE